MKLTCKDLDPVTTCDFEVVGDSASVIAIKMMEHAKEHHDLGISGMKEKGMTDEQILSFMESKVHN